MKDKIEEEDFSKEWRRFFIVWVIAVWFFTGYTFGAKYGWFEQDDPVKTEGDLGEDVETNGKDVCKECLLWLQIVEGN